eukprot:291977_1
MVPLYVLLPLAIFLNVLNAYTHEQPIRWFQSNYTAPFEIDQAIVIEYNQHIVIFGGRTVPGYNNNIYVSYYDEESLPTPKPTPKPADPYSTDPPTKNPSNAPTSTDTKSPTPAPLMDYQDKAILGWNT